MDEDNEMKEHMPLPFEGTQKYVFGEIFSRIEKRCYLEFFLFQIHVD